MPDERHSFIRPPCLSVAVEGRNKGRVDCQLSSTVQREPVHHHLQPTGVVHRHRKVRVGGNPSSPRGTHVLRRSQQRTLVFPELPPAHTMHEDGQRSQEDGHIGMCARWGVMGDASAGAREPQRAWIQSSPAGCVGRHGASSPVSGTATPPEPLPRAATHHDECPAPGLQCFAKVVGRQQPDKTKKAPQNLLHSPIVLLPLRPSADAEGQTALPNPAQTSRQLSGGAARYLQGVTPTGPKSRCSSADGTAEPMPPKASGNEAAAHKSSGIRNTAQRHLHNASSWATANGCEL